jgi:hypothetical protein
MKTNKLALSIFAATAMAASSAALATDMYIDLGSNVYDDTVILPNLSQLTGVAFDADTTTSTFTEFGFSQLLATSVYDATMGPIGIGTTFYDTNKTSDFADLGITPSISGIALDGSTNVTLTQPTVGQVDVDNLSPLTDTDDVEGFGNTWKLTTEYFLDGIITAFGPQYTSGTFTINFESLISPATFVALAGTLSGSAIAGPNLDLMFDITAAADDFLFVKAPGSGFVDVHDILANGGSPSIKLDTNVNPPFPQDQQLLAITDVNGNDVAVRQTTLDGTFIVDVPEPSSIAIFGAGLLALAGLRRKAK